MVGSSKLTDSSGAWEPEPQFLGLGVVGSDVVEADETEAVGLD